MKPIDGQIPDLISDRNALSNWLKSAIAVFQKDLKIEWRTRVTFGAVLLFALTTVIAVSATLSGTLVHSDVRSALLWIVLLFGGLSGLSRTFIREQEAGTMDALRLSVQPTAVYAGKWLFNALLILTVEIVAVPFFLTVLSSAAINMPLFIGIVVLGGIGISSGSTFIAALIAYAGAGKNPLFLVVSFPVLMPLLLLAVQATLGAFEPIPFYYHRSLHDIGLMCTYIIVMTTASFLLFGAVWND